MTVTGRTASSGEEQSMEFVLIVGGIIGVVLMVLMMLSAVVLIDDV
jgi:hypothetical protein